MNRKPMTSVNALGGDFGQWTESLSRNRIPNLEHLIICSRIDSARQALIQSLGIDEAALKHLVDRAKQVVGSRAESLTPVTDKVLQGFQFGVRVTEQKLRRRFEARVHPDAFKVTAPLPSRVSHVDRLPPVRNQGRRGTCVAFGSVAVAEFDIQPPEALSEQFVYWAAKMRDDAPDMEGTTVEAGMQALKDAGVCLHRIWPYNPDPDPNSVHQGPPSPDVRAEARTRCTHGLTDLSLADVDGLKAALAGTDTRKPVLISAGFLVYDSWFKNPLTHQTGEISLPIPGEPYQGGHCMVLAGYCDHADTSAYPGGGYFIVRNSWGAEWAAQSEEAPGYARIPYAYLTEHHMHEAYSVGVATETVRSKLESVRNDRLAGVRARLEQRGRRI